MAGQYTPPECTNILFPDLFSLVAQRNPQRPLAQIICEYVDAPADSIRFTWEEVIQHAQNAAETLRNGWAEHVKDTKYATPRVPGSRSLVVGVLGNNGYNLYANILACTLNRWTVLLISPKNSPAAIEHLLRESNTSLFLVESLNIEFGRAMERTIPDLTVQTFAALDPRLASPAPSLLQPPTCEQLKEEMDLPVFILHTSGSTGHPKIIPWTHAFVLSGVRARFTDDSEFIGLPYYCMAPIIHIMGMCAYFMFPIAHGNLVNFVSSPTPKPPSATSFLSHLPFIKGGLAMVIPSILEELYHLGPEAVQEVAENIMFTVFGGAPLNVDIGNSLVAAGMSISTGWGSTEIGQGTMHGAKKRPEDWEYVIFRKGFDWHFLSVDENSNLKEVIAGPGEDAFPAVINHESPRGYTSNDLWEPHPTIPDLWKHHSRKDDITVLSNGEKSNNKQIENLLLKDKRILYVQVFNSGRPMNGVIIQPADSSVLGSTFVTQIMPTINHANSILPKHSRLIPELVLIAPPDRPFATTDKGTIKRKETLEKFDEEIQNMYAALEQGGTGLEWRFEGDITKEEDLRDFLRNAVHNVLEKRVPDQGDLFEHGLDSLLAIRLRAAVVSLSKRTTLPSQSIPLNIVYTFPTINALTGYLACLITGISELKRTTAERIHDCIAQFATDFVPHRAGAQDPHDKVIALSGSTGSLGSSILDLVLRRDDVEKVYLLNRRGDESQKIRQARGLKEKGIDPTILDSKKASIVYLDVDFSRKDLGLSAGDYAELRDNVTHIIHAAWNLNFNLILESYGHVHIAGVRNLIDVALSSPHAHPPRFIFLSTIAAAAMYHGITEQPSAGDPAGQFLVPEEPIDDANIALEQGYGQSKYVSERVIVAAVKAGLRATIIRIGQLSGATTNGAWTSSESVPIMLRSSLAVGMVPEDLPYVRWVPSDIAASAIVKQALVDISQLQYFSVENPFPTDWTTVARALLAVSPKPLQLVSLKSWLEHIRNSQGNPNKVPAIRLLEFYQALAKGGSPRACLGWEKSARLAPELLTGRITPELIHKYVLYQREVGRL